MKVLPPAVCKFAYSAEAWIVGSAAAPGADLSTVRDFDLLIPFSHWVHAAMLIPRDATPNTFGGWKFKDINGMEIDVWPGDLAWLMTNKMARFAWHVRTGTRLVKTEDTPK